MGRRRRLMVRAPVRRREAEQSIALDRAGMTVCREMKLLAVGPSSERSRSVTTYDEIE